MRLENLGANKTLVHIEGHEYFFSYNTCVAGMQEDGQVWKVGKKYSRTTSKHVNQYLNGREPYLVDESDVQLAMDCL